MEDTCQNPFTLIPVEVFQRIIHFALGDPAFPIQFRIAQLSLVCRSWRDGVKSDGPYWIPIDYSSGEPSWQADIHKARCFWVSFTYNQSSNGQDDLVPFLRLVLDNMDRCCLLELTLTNAPNDDSEEKDLIDAILHHPAPVLQTFKIAAPRRFISTTESNIQPQNRDLEINARFISWQSGMLERLTSLSVEQKSWEQLPSELVSMDRLFEIIQGSPSLHTLGLSDLTLTNWAKVKPSKPLIMPVLRSISLDSLPLDFINLFLSLLVAPRCTWLFAKCNMGGSTIDALLDPACRSLNELLESLANPGRISIKALDDYTYFSCGGYSGTGSFMFVLDDIQDGRAAMSRCLSFYEPNSLQNVKELELCTGGNSSDVLSLLEESLPSVEQLTLQQISQSGWEEVIEYLSRPTGPQCWPLLDELVVLAGNPPYWRFLPDHFLNFLHMRLGITGTGQEPTLKFGKVVVRGVFHESFKKTGAWDKLQGLVDHLDMSERLGYLLYGPGSLGVS